MTKANYVTLSRALFVPIIILFMPFNPYVTFVLYVIAALTDMIDGWVARHFNEVSDFGKIFDQIMDKVLIISMLAGMIFRQNIYGFGWLYLITLIIIVFREFVVSGLRMLAGSMGKVIPANFFGKLKTLFQMILIGIPLWNAMNIYFTVYNWILILIMLTVWFLTAYSGYVYYRLVMNNEIEKDTKDE
jgi:CDP-diacylglycerol--glycerol-3-phosphate 3-phosphatidyltransferase